MSERMSAIAPNPFLSSPGDALSDFTAKGVALVPQFKKIFGERVDGYMRMDYSLRELPALRIYNNDFVMEADNWFCTGTMTADVLLPASVRRNDLQIFTDVLTGALIQQFRRQSFFDSLRAQVPGLNYLGQSITLKKDLAFQLTEEQLVPMAQATINFRVDLREWDLFLESDGRTVDTPFIRTLANLERIWTTIHGESLEGSTTTADVAIQQPV